MTEREMTARERVKELMREFWVVYPSIPTLNLEEKIGQAITAVVAEQRKRAAGKVPRNWTAPLLTGPNAVIGNPPYDCLDIERLFLAIAAAIEGQE